MAISSLAVITRFAAAISITIGIIGATLGWLNSDGASLWFNLFVVLFAFHIMRGTFR